MSESSVKSVQKKGFKAPILNVSEGGVESDRSDDSKAKASKIHKQQLKLQEKHTNPEDKESIQKVKKEKKKQEKRAESNGGQPFPKKEKSLKKKCDDDKQVGEDKTSPKEKKIKKKQKENQEDGKSESSPQKLKVFKKPEVSLTDSQYEDIFRAVLRESNSQHSSPIEQLLEIVASSSQKSSVKDTQKEPLAETEESVKSSEASKDRTSLPELSPWGSHISKQNSQASSILKELQESQASSLLSPEPTSSSNSSEETDGDSDVVVSQKSVRQSYKPPAPAPAPAQRRRKVDKRPQLEELQAARNVGLWVFCDRITCQKQRYLPDVTDPQELPDIWYCHMNPDPRFNSCSCEEQQPTAEEEADMIDNQFTCGSVVWAQVTGFPWWPAMVDDDPDLECYYWLEEDWRTVTFYHVVFFDKNEVTRAWIPLKKIVPFKKNANAFKQRVVRGIDFSSRLQVAREQATEAVSMTVVERLQQFSFIARYKGPIFDDQTQAEKTKKKYKLKCSIGQTEVKKRGRKRRANNSEETPTPFESVVKTNYENNNQKHRKLSEKRVEKKSTVGNTSKREDSSESGKSLKKNPEIKSFVLSSETDINKKTQGNLSCDVGGQTKKLNPEAEAVKEITQENEDCDVSETPSGLCYDSKITTAGKTPQNSPEKVKSKPSSVSGSNVSNKSKTDVPKPGGVTEDSLGSVVEASQVMDRFRAEDEDSQDNKLSQSTIADYLAAETEDAVVPEQSLSQQSEPFEE